jgi:hypothetical protein
MTRCAGHAGRFCGPVRDRFEDAKGVLAGEAAAFRWVRCEFSKAIDGADVPKEEMGHLGVEKAAWPPARAFALPEAIQAREHPSPSTIQVFAPPMHAFKYPGSASLSSQPSLDCSKTHISTLFRGLQKRRQFSAGVSQSRSLTQSHQSGLGTGTMALICGA